VKLKETKKDKFKFKIIYFLMTFGGVIVLLLYLGIFHILTKPDFIIYKEKCCEEIEVCEQVEVDEVELGSKDSDYDWVSKEYIKRHPEWIDENCDCLEVCKTKFSGTLCADEANSVGWDCSKYKCGDYLVEVLR